MSAKSTDSPFYKSSINKDCKVKIKHTHSPLCTPPSITSDIQKIELYPPETWEEEYSEVWFNATTPAKRFNIIKDFIKELLQQRESKARLEGIEEVVKLSDGIIFDRDTLNSEQLRKFIKLMEDLK